MYFQSCCCSSNSEMCLHMQEQVVPLAWDHGCGSKMIRLDWLRLPTLVSVAHLKEGRREHASGPIQLTPFSSPSHALSSLCLCLPSTCSAASHPFSPSRPCSPLQRTLRSFHRHPLAFFHHLPPVVVAAAPPAFPEHHACQPGHHKEQGLVGDSAYHAHIARAIANSI